VELIYDVHSMPVRWTPLLASLGVWYFVVLFTVLMPLAHDDPATRRVERLKFGLVAVVISVIGVSVLYSSVRARYECRNADPAELEMTEGIVSNLRRSSSRDETRFRLDDRNFVERNGALSRPCGFTSSVHDIVNLRDGDAVRLEHIRGRTILRAWRLTPASG